MFSEYDGFQTNPMHKTRSESDYMTLTELVLFKPDASSILLA